MGILDRFKYGKNTVNQSTTSAPLNSIQSGYHFQSGEAGVSDLIYGVVQKLVNTVSMADLNYYEDGKKTTNKLTYKLKYNINPYQTFLEFMIFMETQRNLKGNAFAYILRGYNDSDILGIYPLNADDVSTYRLSDGKLYYKLNYKAPNVPDLIHPEDMIHVKNISVNAIYTNSKGVSPMNILKNVTELDMEVQTAAIDKLTVDFSNFLITDKTTTTKATKDAILNMLTQYYNNSGGHIYNDFGVDLERLSSTFNFTDLESAEKSVKSRLAVVYNVPSTIIGAAYDYNGIEETNRFFIQSTIAPILKQYEDQFTKKILGIYSLDNGSFFTFDSMSLIKYDLKTLTDHYTKLFRSSIMSSDEVRGKLNLDPRGGNADKLMISGDMYPLDMEVSERKSHRTNESQNSTQRP